LRKQPLPVSGIIMFPRPRPRFAPGGTCGHVADDSREIFLRVNFLEFPLASKVLSYAQNFSRQRPEESWPSRKFGHRSLLSCYVFRFVVDFAPDNFVGMISQHGPLPLRGLMDAKTGCHLWILPSPWIVASRDILSSESRSSPGAFLGKTSWIL